MQISHVPSSVYSVCTHVSSSHANLLEQKKVFTYEKNSTPTGLVWFNNMAADSLLLSRNMAAMTSCGYVL